MVKLYIGITDFDWFRFLRETPGIAEVNFWQPGGKTNFRALQQGELFLFKLHAPRHFIVGGGIFVHANVLPISVAWDTFGISNGAPSLEIMKERVARYLNQQVDPSTEYSVGCRILAEPFFLPENEWIPVPPSWSRYIQSGRTYNAEDPDVRGIWQAFAERVWFAREPSFAEPRWGNPTLIRPRLGQGSFRISVADAYQRRCAVSGEKTLPILDAAHIQPYAAGGAHDVRNGILLRTDIHKLFDLGYVTISDDYKFEVSGKLKQDFTNGRHYYAMHGNRITPTRNPTLMPSREALQWHQTYRFRG